MVTEKDIEQFGKQCEDIFAQVSRDVIGQKEVIDALKEAGLRDKVMVMVGGAPVTEQFAKEIGADCYTDDAASAADAVYEYLTK